MARLIVKSPYIKGGGAGGYMRYIATRENVELIPDDRPATRRQEQLIRRMEQDFPDMRELAEYETWTATHTKHAASSLISVTQSIHEQEMRRSDMYMKYIAERPRAERLGTHGLFGDEDHVDLEEAMAEIGAYPGNIWTHILSLRREDAVRLGYDNAATWRDLLKAHRNDIAEAMKIQPDHFRWYAAFHDEGEHPHVHLMAWSSDPKEAYLTTDGIQKIRSTLTNDIFHDEMLHLYEQKRELRDELIRQSREAVKELTKQMQSQVCGDPKLEELFQELTVQMKSVKGKKQYGYLPKQTKALVNEIVDRMQQLPTVGACYNRWLDLQEQVRNYYSEQKVERLPLSQQKEFRHVKNAVVQEAVRVMEGRITFEDGDEPREEQPDAQTASFDYQYLQEVIADPSMPLEVRDNAVKGLWQLAGNGDVHAQYRVGQLCRDGGVMIPDWYNARYWFREAAEQGMPEAQNALGNLLLSNDPEVRDVQEGVRWLETAAANGSVRAAYRLGKEYLKGETVKRDVQTAMAYFRDAAYDGDPNAQYILGKLYLGGKETERDRERAGYWLEQSAAQGNPYAALLLERLDDPKPSAVLLSTTKLLHHMSQIFRDNLPAGGPAGVPMDQKRRQALQEKRVAMGHKADDHEDAQNRKYQGQTMGW